MPTRKKDITFNVTSLDSMSDKKLNEIVDKVLKTKKGASALKSMMRSVMKSTLKSAVKSAMKSPMKSPMRSPLKTAKRAKNK